MLAFAPAAMAAYMLPQYVLGAHYDTIEGNNEDFFLWHLALLVLSLAVAVLAWREASLAALPRWSGRARRWGGILMLVVALFLLARYLPTFIDVWRGRPPATYEEDPIAFWIIALLDLGIVAPAAAATGVALLRGVEDARRPMLAIVGWFALVGPAVAAMAYAGVANDDSSATLGGAIAFTVYGVLFAALAAYLLRPLFRGRPT